MEDDEFVAVDRLFARSVLKPVEKAKEEMFRLIAEVMAEARAGHLCIEVEDRSLLPDEIFFPDGPLVLDGNLLYLRRNWEFERRFKAQIERLSSFALSENNDLIDLPSSMLPAQREAVLRAHAAPVSLITGGPGTGKTFTAKQIVQTFPHNARIAVCAPTGKAASLLKGVCPNGFVGTLHTLLRVKPGRTDSALVLPYDLIVVDECSMIDASLFAALLEGVHEGTHLVLMGDPDQLPPVEAGSLFADLISLDLFPMTRLSQCMRTERSVLLDLAQAITVGDAGGAFDLIERENLTCDFGFSKGAVPFAYDEVFNCVQRRFSLSFSEKPDSKELLEAMGSFRILSCLRKGPLGTHALNQMIVKRLYIEAKVGSYLALPILVTRSVPELDLYNGQTGVLVKRVTGHAFALEEGDVVLFPEKEISPFLVSHFEYAFCLSVHKSQGSEYESVILLVPPGSERFGREVLYTAVTRAKKELLIDGDPAILKAGIAASSLKRSGLLCHARLETC